PAPSPPPPREALFQGAVKEHMRHRHSVCSSTCSCSGVGRSLQWKALRPVSPVAVCSSTSVYVLLWHSKYWRIMSWLTSPAVLRKNERVHSEGNFFNWEPLPQVVRTATRDEPGNVRGQRVGIGRRNRLT